MGIEDVLLNFGLPAVVGLGIGILSGLLGIGGGTIMVPIFRLAFGLNPLMSTATSLFTIIPTSVSGAVSHVKGKTCVLALGVAAGIGGAITSPVGVWLASVSPGWLVMLAAALIIGYSAVNMLKKALKAPSSRKSAPEPLPADGGGATLRTPSSPSHDCGSGAHEAEGRAAQRGVAQPLSAGAAEGEAAKSAAGAGDEVPPAPKLSVRQLLMGSAIGLGAGLASGYVGVGGGFIMVPLMLSVVGIPMKLASGTSLIAVMILAIPGTIENALAGNIDYIVGLSVAVGSIPGAVIGAHLVKRVPERLLRFIFGGFLIVAAVILFLNEFMSAAV